MTTRNQRGADGKEIALEARENTGFKLTSPSVARNRDVILEAFERHIPLKGRILEIASGTGEHGAYITEAFSELCWQPSDPDEASRKSIMAWGDDIGRERFYPPLHLDVTTENWWQTEGLSKNFDGIICINMIHIAPFTAVEGLFRGACELLEKGGKLFFYGPFSRRGEMAESNHRFDADLKRRDTQWGVRDLDLEIQPLATRFVFNLVSEENVPANNMVVLFEKG